MVSQLPAKKLLVNATEPTTSTPSSAEAKTGGAGVASSFRSQRPISSNGLKSTEVLTTAWKDDVDAGNLLSSLFELFGEGMLSFVKFPELSLHL